MADSEQERNEDGNESRNEDIIEPDGPYRDEEKTRREDATTLKNLISQVDTLHSTILLHPELWFRPELQATREFVEKIKNDPAHFPPALPTSTGNEARDTGRAVPPLTKGIAKKLYAGTVCDHTDVDDEFPVVLVTAIDCKHRNVELGSRANREKHFVLLAADGDDDILTLLVGTQLNSRMGTVEVGSVIELRSFVRGFRPRVPDTPERMSVLVSNFSPCGSMEVKDSLLSLPTERLTVQHPNREDEESNEDDTDDDDDDSDYGGGTSWESAICTSSRPLCKKHGYQFDVCVTEAYPINEFCLEEIAQECWFVTKEVSSMEPSDKRNVLYWWFMVNVYRIGGAGKRKHPPACLIKAIRDFYPNPEGVPYVGFSRKRKRH